MGLIVLITGPLWAKPAWGYFWSFEPRLNLMLLTVFIFIGYLVVRRQTSTTTRQLSAGIAVAGAVAVPFIHWAIELFGQDSHPNDIINSEDGMHPDMRIAFLVSVLAILVLASYLIWWRYRHHRQRDQVEELFLRVSELEDGI